MRIPMASLALAVLLGLSVAQPALPADKSKPVRPPTRQTQTLRADTYKKMEAIQQAFEAKDYAAARQGLDALKSGEAKLNDYEKAMLYTLYAAVHYAQDEVPKAIEAYATVLKQPKLPEGLRDSTLFALAQMYLMTEQYDKAVIVLKKWFEVAEEPSGDAYVLLAQAYYQQQKYADAEASILQGLRIAKARQQQPKESWLALLRAVYYELDQYDRSAKVLEVLIALYPKETYYLQLSGMYGLMNQQMAQLTTLHAAYQAGMVTRPSELLNLARLYLVEDAPYPAVQLLGRAFDEQVLERNAENLQLYAQALALAKEYEKQIPVLEQLARLTGESRHFTYLGQAQSELGRWQAAVASFRGALKGKGLDDPDSVRMQLGTALFNAGELREARRTFIAALESPKYAESASSWVKFVSAEIERQKALSGTPQQADAPTDTPTDTPEDTEPVQQESAPGDETGRPDTDEAQHS